jgi:hypothetical protein
MSKEAGSKGRDSSSARTWRVRLSGLGRGRSASRWRREADESAAMSSEFLVASGGEVGAVGSGSGFSRVRARARLQEFAPRSRTRGKWRLTSCGGC